MTRIHMLSGSKEYRSEETLIKLAEYLSGSGIAQCGISAGEEKGTTLPGLLENISSIDVLLVFCKRMELVDEQLAAIQNWCRECRPVIGIRTASHAFQTWLEFDGEILGGSYDGHGPAEDEVRVEVKAPDHPVMEGIADWTRPGKVYNNPTLADHAVELLHARSETADEPVAWCRERSDKHGRVFYTSMGCVPDFDDPSFLRMMGNAARWAAGEREGAA